MTNIKGKNIFKPYKKKHTYSNFGNNIFDKKKLAEKLKTTYVDAPISLSLIKSTKETIEFINKLQDLCDKKKPVFVKIKHLQFLDNSGITVLLSVVYLFKVRNISFNGDFPDSVYCHETLLDSGFFDSLKANKPPISDYTIGKRNQVFTKAKKEVDASIGLPIQKEVSMTIWGEKRALKGLQRILVELMHNTNNHADLIKKGEKHWWLSISHNKTTNKVDFIFLDYGIGIFNSLSSKPKDDLKWSKLPEYIINFLKNINKTNADLLQELLEGKIHMSVTGKHFRGKGLPGIKQAFDRNSVKNLVIITNNVKADIQSKNYEIIDTQFDGTFVSWHLDATSDNLPWTIIE